MDRVFKRRRDDGTSRIKQCCRPRNLRRNVALLLPTATTKCAGAVKVRRWRANRPRAALFGCQWEPDVDARQIAVCPATPYRL